MCCRPNGEAGGAKRLGSQQLINTATQEYFRTAPDIRGRCEPGRLALRW